MLLRLALAALFSLVCGHAHADTATDLDADRSGTVDFPDFVAFARVVGKADPVFDLDGSGTVDFADFVTFAAAFGGPTGYRVIVFPDRTLDGIIRARIGLPSGDLTVSHLQGLDSLSVRDTRVRDFTGIGYLTGLKYLQVLGNALADATPIGALTGLETLYLTNVSFTDPSFLSHLTNLHTLTVGTTAVGGPSPLRSLSPLARLTNLTTLTVYAGYVSDLSPLSGLVNLGSLWIHSPLSADLSWVAPLQDLKSLRLEAVNGELVDASPLAGLLKLEQVVVTGPPQVTARQPTLTNVGVLSGLPALFSIFAEAVDVQDLSVFADWPSLSMLGLGNSPLSSLAGVGAIPHLKALTLGPVKNASTLTVAQLVPPANTITDLTPLASAPRLQELTLSVALVTSLAPLEKISTLRTMRIYAPKVTDFSGIASHAELESLSITGEKQDAVLRVTTAGANLKYLSIEWVDLDADFGNGLPSLENLVVRANDQFVDFSGLGTLAALRSLTVSNVPLQDISALSTPPDLERVQIWQSGITDVEALVSNPGIGVGDVVSLAANPLTDEAKAVQIPLLISRGVTVSF